MSSVLATPAVVPALTADTNAEWPPLWEFVEGTGLRSVVLGPSKDPNAKITILLVETGGGRPVLAVKAPTTQSAARSIVAEAQLLDEFHAAHRGGVAGTIPRVLGFLDFEGRPSVVTTAVPGVSMTTSYFRFAHTASRSRVSADFRSVERWLTAFQWATAGESESVAMTADVERQLLSRFPDEELANDLQCLAEIAGRLRASATPRTMVHGDLWFGNLLVERGRVTGVVDWEAGSATGEPLRDLVRFALMYALYLDRGTPLGGRIVGHRGLKRGSWGAGVSFALEGRGWFPEVFRLFLQRGLVRLGADPEAWSDIVLAGIAEVAAYTDHDGFARRQLELFRRLSRRPRRSERPGHSRTVGERRSIHGSP